MNNIRVPDYEVLDVVLLCHAGLAQDSPNPPEYYLNEILSRAFSVLPASMRPQVDEYLAEKKYLPEVKIELSK